MESGGTPWPDVFRSLFVDAALSLRYRSRGAPSLPAMPQRAILHIDMDAFYAAVEQRDQPELRGKPVVIGGPRDGRGVVSAASYEARVYGIHSALPSRTAAARCPDAVFLPPRMTYYAEVSQQLHAIFHRYTPLVESLSLDEAFLDVTGSRRAFGDAPTIARTILADIASELDLPASAGVAHNKFLAKLGSALEKPQGFVIFGPDDARARLAPLPIERLWGVGKATAPRMHDAGYHRFGDLADDTPDRVRHVLGEHGLALQALARGEDNRPVIPEREAKSIGRETTFAEDVADRAVLRATLYRLAESVGWRLRRAGLHARRVSLKLRFDSFETVTRDVTLGTATNLDEVIFFEAWGLAEAVEWRRPAIRLIGVSTSHFDREDCQLQLFSRQPAPQEKVAQVLDDIRERMGPGTIRRAGAIAPNAKKDRGDGRFGIR